MHPRIPDLFKLLIVYEFLYVLGTASSVELVELQTRTSFFCTSSTSLGHFRIRFRAVYFYTSEDAFT